MALTDDDVRRVAKLARLSLSDAEITACRGQLEQILGYMERLADVDVTGVEPAPYPFDTTLPLRPDEPVPGLTTDAVLALAPESEDGHIVVPKVIG